MLLRLSWLWRHSCGTTVSEWTFVRVSLILAWTPVAARALLLRCTCANSARAGFARRSTCVRREVHAAIVQSAQAAVHSLFPLFPLSFLLQECCSCIAI